MTQQPILSKSQAELQLVLWNKQAEDTSDDELYVRLQKLGLPEELTSRLHGLIGQVQDFANAVVRIGKVILMQILDFVEENLFLVSGVGIGFVLGAAIYGLIVSVPYIGAFLTPIADILRVTMIGSSAVIGYELDQVLPGVGKSLREIAGKFFELLIRVFNSIFSATNTSYTHVVS